MPRPALPYQYAPWVGNVVRPLPRTLLAVACGFAAGLAVGPASLLMVHASDAWMRGWAWPEFDAKFCLILLISSIPAGVNGAIGAGLAAALGRGFRGDITWLPAGLHAIAAVLAILPTQDSLVLSQLVALVFSIVVWPAGRLGQRIGSAFNAPTRGDELAPADLGHS